MGTFKAIVVDKTDSGQSVALTDFDEADLMEGNVVLRPEWSTVNYKDGLAVTNKAPVVRRFPMIAGVDGAGTVETSTHPDWKSGDKVILERLGLRRDPSRSLCAEGARQRRLADLAPHEVFRPRRDGDRNRRRYRDARRHGARARRGHAGSRADHRHRRGRRRRLDRGRAAREARLPSYRLYGTSRGGRLSQEPRRIRGDCARAS